MRFMKKNLTKKDIIWNYLSKAFSLFSGLITLPMILSFLSQDEIALNYIFLNIISFVFLFDFGFSSQFSRNVAFAFGGANDINLKGFQIGDGKELNYRLIKSIIVAAQNLYLRIGAFVLIVLLTFGTWYVYTVTLGFSLVSDALALWLVFVILEFLDFYFKFYTPLMLGKGQIAEVNQIEIYSNICKVLVTIILLLLGGRLWSVLIGMGVKIALVRASSYYEFYYRDGLKQKMAKILVTKAERKVILSKVWYNAKRTGIVQISSFATTQIGLFFTGIYLDTESLASYGLLMQLVSVISSVSLSLGYSSLPLFSQFRASGNLNALKNGFYFSLGMFYIIYGTGSLVLLFVVPYLLPLIRANAVLPTIPIVLIYLLNKFLEGQHCLSICCLSSKNVVYDFESATLLGVLTVILLYFGFEFMGIGLLGLVILLFLVQLVYPNWKWPYEICKDLDISYRRLVCNSLSGVGSRLSHYFKFKQ